jgi:molybdopterin-guanine dinucleotide biosynthesis protein A
MRNFNMSIKSIMEFKTTFPVSDLYGIVICGGKSSRMGMDKAMLDYHGKAQCYYVYEMLSMFCEKVLISCTEQQAERMDVGYETLTDLSYYSDIGPMGGLLTALTSYSHQKFLVIGCDYPFLNKEELADFLQCCDHETVAAAFYNKKENLYEPLLAYYHNSIKSILLEMFESGQYSLQHFLEANNAVKYYPADNKAITSIDTIKEFIETKQLLELSE